MSWLFAYDHDHNNAVLCRLKAPSALLRLGQERLMSRNMKIHQKTTFSSRMKSRSHLSQLTFYAEAGGGGSLEDLGLDPTLILRLTEGKQAHATLRFKTRASSVGEIYWWRESVCYFEIRPPEGASHPGHSV